MKQKVVCILLLISNIIYSYNRHHVNIVKQKRAEKKYVNAGGVDFRGASMPGIDFSGCQLSKANFGVAKKPSETVGIISIPGQVTNLNGANFSQSILISTNFDQANLQKTNFAGADVQYANFSGADLTGAILDGIVNGQIAMFCGATMPDGSKFTDSTWKSKSGLVLYSNCSKTASS